MNIQSLIPQFTNPEDQRRANILAVTQLAAALMITAILIISIIFTPEHKEVLIQGVVGTGAMLGSYYLLRKGKLRLSAWIVAILGWLILTLDLFLIAGIRGVNVLGQVLIIMFTGLVIDGRSSLLITVLTVGVDFVILQMESHGFLASPSPLDSTFARWFIQSVYLLLAAIYISRADVIIKKSIWDYQATADRFRALFEHTNDCVIVFDLDWKVVLANSHVETLLGIPPEEISESDIADQIRSSAPYQIEDLYNQQLHRSEFSDFEAELKRKDGVEIPVEISIAVVPDPNGHPQRIQTVLRDISDRKAYEKQLQHQALHDPLTNLPNRLYFKDQYQRAGSQAAATDELVAILFIDLDDFKYVNDHFGHGVGDQVLVEMGSRLQRSLRESDIVARMGGDEFAIILDSVPNKQNVKIVAEKILANLSQPFMIEGLEIRVTASIGINITQRSKLNEMDLVATSDSAMYQVKEEGKNNFRFYDLEKES